MKILITESQRQTLNELLRLGRQERVHISKEPITSLKEIVQKEIIEQRRIYGKPSGLWYGFGDSWIYFAKNQMPTEYFGERKYGYKIYPNMNRLLVLNTDEDLENFINKYHYNTRQTPESMSEFHHMNDIKWSTVAESYDGIELPNYEQLGWRSLHMDHSKYAWLFPWEINSGCIWKPTGIAKIKPL